MFPTAICAFTCNTYKSLKKLSYPGPLSWCSNSTHDSALGEWQKCDTPSGTTLGQPPEGTPRFGMPGMEFLFVLGKNHPSKGKLWGPCATSFPKHQRGALNHPSNTWGGELLPFRGSSPAPCRAGAPAAPRCGSSRCHPLAAWPRQRSWSIVPSPSPFTAEKPFSQSLQPFSPQCLDSRGYRRGKKKGGKKKERERKKEQCAIGTALEMEKVLKACNIHQGWIHKCHILNKPSKRQWQRKGALLQESLSFSFAAVRNLFFASHSISHYSINEVTSHSYWLACQSPCLIP